MDATTENCSTSATSRSPSARATADARRRSRLVRINKGETVALVGESGSGKSVTALSVMKLLPYPAAQPSLRHDPLQGPGAARSCRARDAPGARQRHHHDLPGADDLAQPAAHDREADRRDAAAASGHDRAGGARAHARAADPGRHPRSGDAARELSAPALRRPAPARDDRDGARQRARPADRRRADHRARRHRAGADSHAAKELQKRLGMAMLFITHDLGIVRSLPTRSA